VTLAGPAMRGPGWAAGCSGPGGGRADPGGARGAIRGGERTIGDLKRGHTRRALCPVGPGPGGRARSAVPRPAGHACAGAPPAVRAGAAFRRAAGRAGLADRAARPGRRGAGAGADYGDWLDGRVGKTALAVYWAHQVAGRFPDRQLYVNLRGFDPSGRPVAAAEAIRAVLDTVGVPAGQIPAGLDALAGLYRSVLAGKRMLVLLDNARDAGQIRPPRPPSGRLPIARGHTPQPAGCAPRSTAASSGRWWNASWRP
jgi:hypothetical protein